MMCKGKIKIGATFRAEKQVWRLKSAQSFLRNLLKEVPDSTSDDILDLKACIQILGKVIGRQIQ
jgi:hypothetical protein